MNCPMLETAADLQEKLLGEDTYNAFSKIATICKEERIAAVGIGAVSSVLT